MAYSNLFKLWLYLLQKKSYSSFPMATLFLSHNIFLSWIVYIFFHNQVAKRDCMKLLTLMNNKQEKIVTKNLDMFCKVTVLHYDQILRESFLVLQGFISCPLKGVSHQN